MQPTDNATWLLEAGDKVILRQSAYQEPLTAWEQLVFCLWVADYGMRNAGDLQTASDFHPTFNAEGEHRARQLNAKEAEALYSLPQSEMEKHYFARFEAVCTEPRTISPR